MMTDWGILWSVLAVGIALVLVVLILGWPA